MQSYDIFLIDSGLITKLTFIVLGTRLVCLSRGVGR